MKILKDKGIFAFICSNKFAKAKYGEKLRKYILNKEILIFDDFNGIKVFKEASIDTCIIKIKNTYDEENKIFVNQDFHMEQNKLSSDIFTFERPEIISLKEKIISQSTPLEKLNIEINYGIKNGLNEAFIINEDIKNKLISIDSKNENIIKPVLRGRDVKKGIINFAELYLLYIPWHFKIEDYPSIKEYLSTFEKLYERPAVKDNKHEWFALSSYASKCYESFEKPKLIYPDISQGLFAVFDDNGYFINDRCFMITHNKENVDYLKALSCILSSDLLNFIFKISGALLGSSGFKLAKVHMKNLPICDLSDKNIRTLSEINDKIQKIINELKISNDENLKNELEDLYNKLNEEIYQLYGLNIEEIELVENSI